MLVVGSGQSGAQIAEECHRAARTVHLCVGSEPRIARRYRGRDVAAWLDELGHEDRPVRRPRLGDDALVQADPYVADLRRLAREGMRLYGRLLDIQDAVLRFATDLKRSLDAADSAANAIREAIDGHIAARGIDAPAEPPEIAAWVQRVVAKGLLHSLGVAPLAGEEHSCGVGH